MKLRSLSTLAPEHSPREPDERSKDVSDSSSEQDESEVSSESDSDSESHSTRKRRKADLQKLLRSMSDALSVLHNVLCEIDIERDQDKYISISILQNELDVGAFLLKL